MPIYEYRCEQCGHELDALQKISEPPLTDCPDCDAPALKKLVSAPSFRLKGSGWYETDFKKDKRRNLADGGDAPKDSAKDGAKDTRTDGAAVDGKGSGKAADAKPAAGDKRANGDGSGKAASA